MTSWRTPFFGILSFYIARPWALRTLELGDFWEETELKFSRRSLLRALRHGLANLRALGFSDAFYDGQVFLGDEEINAILSKQAENENTSSNEETKFGVYFF